jgi:heptosyltransferase I
LTDAAEVTAKIEHLLIVRLSSMGDVIHTLPAAQALRAAFPQAMIGWLIEERWADLLCAPGKERRGPRSDARPLADWVHTVQLKCWRKSFFSATTVQQIAKTWNDVRSVNYNVAVDLQGAIRSAVLARWSGARVIVGAAETRESPASLWYSRRVIPRGAHVIEQYFSVAEAVAQKKLTMPRVEFPHDHHAEQRVDQRLREAGISKFAILCPGAGWGAKRWPPERYGFVARELSAGGTCCVVNYGPGEEELAREAEAVSEGTAKAMKTSISELIALTRRARLFIGGDTGPLHLAAAMQVPVVAIFGPTDPVRNGPYGTRSVVLRSAVSTTSHTRRSDPDEGLMEIGVDAVVNAARALLSDADAGKACPEPVEGSARAILEDQHG